MQNYNYIESNYFFTSAKPAKKYAKETNTQIAWVDVHEAILLELLKSRCQSLEYNCLTCSFPPSLSQAFINLLNLRISFKGTAFIPSKRANLISGSSQGSIFFSKGLCLEKRSRDPPS